MKRILAVLAVLFCLAVPVTAEEIVSEVSGSLAWSDNDQIRQWEAGFNLDFPLGSVLQIGPAVHMTEAVVSGQPTFTTWDLGGRLTLNFTGRDGLFAAVSALYHTGDVTGSYTITPELGLKFGGDGAFVRISIAQPYQLDETDTGEKTLLDLEQTQVVAAIGARF